MFSKEKLDFPDRRKILSWQINSPKICGFAYRSMYPQDGHLRSSDIIPKSWKYQNFQNHTSRIYCFIELRRTLRTVLFNVNTRFTCLVKKKHGIRIIEKVYHGELTHQNFAESRFGRDASSGIEISPWSSWSSWNPRKNGNLKITDIWCTVSDGSVGPSEQFCSMWTLDFYV